ncbi:unnamed protein product [Cryptosporidium hominis]|uniref:Uncharacterized protein n=1 Tax=Cryptosporidium hominis TaxID=237895 RepID=A0A0S4TJI1_CRYHO|nr:hypothetical protein ChTU502y2012_407g2600 [Cryptosporidium hominis]PPA65951.1 hypothetical protein ChUKH1_15395 [Cryptosporidium hominis]CUV07517.1 unnamed protein product [Cryptosporidium hominis]
MYNSKGSNEFGELGHNFPNIDLSLEKVGENNYFSVRPSVLHSISSAFPANKRGLIELVVTELFNEFSVKPDNMVEDAKYGLCIPTLYSVLLLTICHVHKLKDFEEEWFEGFLKSRKFPLLTPFGCKNEALFNLLSALACFGSSLKKRPAVMQGVELVLLRLGISFYFSLCQIMDHPFSTNRFIKALITGAHEWIHGSQGQYIPNKLEGTFSSRKKSSFTRKRSKELIQEHTVKSLIGIFDDFSIKLICNFGYRPNCITWNEVNKYVQNLKDSSLSNLFKSSNSNGGFFQETTMNEFIRSVYSLYQFNESKKDSLISSNIDTNQYYENSNNIVQNTLILTDNKILKRDLPIEEYSMGFIDISNNLSSYQKEDTFSLSEFQESDEYDSEEIDNEFDQEFSEKLYNLDANTNKALDAISSKLKGMSVSTSGRIFNLNLLTKKYLNKAQSSLYKSNSKGMVATENKKNKDLSSKECINEKIESLKNIQFESNSVSRRPSWSQFAHIFSIHGANSNQNPRNDPIDTKLIKSSSNINTPNYIKQKQQIYESEDDEDPLNVL